MKNLKNLITILLVAFILYTPAHSMKGKHGESQLRETKSQRPSERTRSWHAQRIANSLKHKPIKHKLEASADRSRYSKKSRKALGFDEFGGATEFEDMHAGEKAEPMASFFVGVVDLKVTEEGIKILELGDFRRSGSCGGYYYCLNESVLKMAGQKEGLFCNIDEQKMKEFHFECEIAKKTNDLINSLGYYKSYEETPVRGVETFKEVHSIIGELLKSAADKNGLDSTSQKGVFGALSDYHLIAKGAAFCDHFYTFPSYLYHLQNVLTNFMKRYRVFLINDMGIASYIFSNKFLTHLFFKEAGFEAFRPNCLVCSKTLEFADGYGWQVGSKVNLLASEIRRQITFKEGEEKIFIIKPIGGSCGKGILVVNDHFLEDNLRVILAANLVHQNQCDMAFLESWLKRPIDEIERAWVSDSHPLFLVEKCEKSIPVTFEGRLYEPTMRVVFLVKYDKGEYSVDFIESFWKIPKHDIASNSGRSSIVNNGIGGNPHDLLVDDKVKEMVYRQLSVILPKLYSQTLKMTIPQFVDQLQGSRNQNKRLYGNFLDAWHREETKFLTGDNISSSQ